MIPQRYSGRLFPVVATLLLASVSSLHAADDPTVTILLPTPGGSRSPGATIPVSGEMTFESPWGRSGDLKCRVFTTGHEPPTGGRCSDSHSEP